MTIIVYLLGACLVKVRLFRESIIVLIVVLQCYRLTIVGVSSLFIGLFVIIF